MGNGYGVQCKHCAYQEEFLLGVGVSFRRAIDRLPEGEKNKMNQKLEGKVVKEEYDSYRLYRCETCDGLSSDLYVEILTTDEEIIKTEHICSICQREKNRIEPLFRELPCPTCHKKSLEVESFLRWD